MNEFEKLKEAAVPLQQILQECYDPMHIIVVSSQGVKVLGSVAGIPNESVCVGTFDSARGYFVPVKNPEEDTHDFIQSLKVMNPNQSFIRGIIQGARAAWVIWTLLSFAGLFLMPWSKIGPVFMSLCLLGWLLSYIENEMEKRG